MPDPLEPGAAYTALGSSFAAGPGITPVVDEAAGRSGRNYAHLVAERLGLVLTDVTRSGAVSDDLLRPGRTRTRPLRRTPVPAQLDGVTPATRLVTLTVGGNDLGYVGGLFRAVLVNRGPGRLPVVGPRLTARTRIVADPAAVARLTDTLTRVVESVHTTAPDARVLIVDYLTLVGADPHPTLPLTAAQRDQAQAMAAVLTATYRTVADRAGAELVEAAEASRDHHAGATEPWVTGWVGRSGVSFHPNAAGMAAVADLVVDRLGARP